MQGTQLVTGFTVTSDPQQKIIANNSTQKSVRCSPHDLPKPSCKHGGMTDSTVPFSERLSPYAVNPNIDAQKNEVLKGDDKVGHHSEATQARPLASVTAAEPPWSSVPAALSPAGPVSAAFARIGVCSAPAPA